MDKMSMEAMKQALKDIRAELKSENKSFISISRKALYAERDRNINDIYCSAYV